MVPDKFSNQVALCFAHLTAKTQKYYTDHKILPPWADLVAYKKVGPKIPNSKKGEHYKWTGIKYNRKALKEQNLFNLQTIETLNAIQIENHHTPQPRKSGPTILVPNKIKSKTIRAQLHMAIETEHLVESVDDSRQDLYKINLFELPQTKTVETKDVASLDVHMAIETEHIVQAISDTRDIDDVQFEVAVPSTSVRLHKTWHEDQLRSETDISSDESDADVLVQAKKTYIYRKRYLPASKH